MNKQRFLAELRRLLVFMTEEDRELTVRLYTEMFEDAGEEGEAELLGSLGSPTKVAIGMSRGYEPGKAASRYETMRLQREQEKAQAQAQADGLPELPTFDDAPDIGLPEEAEADEPTAEPPEEDEYEESEEESVAEIEPVRFSPAEPEIVRPMPLGLGIPLFTLGMIAVGLPLLALVLACLPVALCPGAAGCLAAGLAAIGALWCLTYIADALLLFGAAFIILALGLTLLWGGIWCCVKLVGLYVRFVRWFAGAVLGKREA